MVGLTGVMSEVSTLRLHAVRAAEIPSGEVPEQVAPEIGFQLDGSTGTMAVRLSCAAQFSWGELEVEVGAQFELDDDSEPLQEADLRSLSAMVGIPTVYPFLRETVADVTRRVFGSALQLDPRLAEPGRLAGTVWKAEASSESAEANTTDA